MELKLAFVLLVLGFVSNAVGFTRQDGEVDQGSFLVGMQTYLNSLNNGEETKPGCKRHGGHRGGDSEPVTSTTESAAAENATDAAGTNDTAGADDAVTDRKRRSPQMEQMQQAMDTAKGFANMGGRRRRQEPAAVPEGAAGAADTGAAGTNDTGAAGTDDAVADRKRRSPQMEQMQQAMDTAKGFANMGGRRRRQEPAAVPEGAAGAADTGAAGAADTGAAGAADTGAAGTPDTGAAGTPDTGADGAADTGAADAADTGAAGTPDAGAAGTPDTGAAGAGDAVSNRKRRSPQMEQMQQAMDTAKGFMGGRRRRQEPADVPTDGPAQDSVGTVESTSAADTAEVSTDSYTEATGTDSYTETSTDTDGVTTSTNSIKRKRSPGDSPMDTMKSMPQTFMQTGMSMTGRKRRNSAQGEDA